VRRRFERSNKNFFAYYRLLAERWILFDSSSPSLAIVAAEEQGELRVFETKRYNELVACYEKK
jgi:predicted ABC-type ATPase